MNILLTSVGRRVELLKAFRQSMYRSNIPGKIVTADLKKTAPASFLADVAELVPRIDAPDYIERVLEICNLHQIDLLIPLIDTELHLLSLHKQKFNERGTRLLISSAKANEICYSKKQTGSFFKQAGVKTPKIYELGEVTDRDFPLIVKPDTGSSSVGVYYVKNRSELNFFTNYVQDAIIQEAIVGEEYTIDVLLDFNGNVISIVPRLRIETRAGEISKGITIKNPRLIAAAKKVVEALPGAIGCITVQCFLQPDGEIVFIEINPRFGGGYPLSYRAGADFPSWLMQLCVGDNPKVGIDEWEDGLAMLRYDDAIFVKGSQIAS
ncbi:ATP-grasp domain-containing protein [Chamaesiphon minutus]|uniref:Carbamoylphosphate synthase large subunit n=1 Tax=Chamaesiphon minutus (strain ATCC 27169 / PCC 6605) TaxID=1173020 RepID=K9ULG0_CHAP6|nr:ATP-grasp domain-containing protein [Chamaesiphon minutus]AFY95660.1 carbamoylphosphate synthase large subunit [Chamaesiphon minutus PCC 6605]